MKTTKEMKPMNNLQTNLIVFLAMTLKKAGIDPINASALFMKDALRGELSQVDGFDTLAELNKKDGPTKGRILKEDGRLSDEVAAALEGIVMSGWEPT